MTLQRGAVRCRLSKLVLLTCLATTSGFLHSATAEAAKEMPLSAAEAAERSLQLPIDTFQKRLNGQLASAQTGFKAGKPEISEGPVNDVMNMKVGPHNVVVATLKKGTRQIKELMIVGSGDGTPKSGMTMLMAISAVFAATTPDLQVKDVLPNLPAILKGEDQQHGGVSFSAIKTPTMGAVFTAQSAH